MTILTTLVLSTGCARSGGNVNKNEGQDPQAQQASVVSAQKAKKKCPCDDKNKDQKNGVDGDSSLSSSDSSQINENQTGNNDNGTNSDGSSLGNSIDQNSAVSNSSDSFDANHYEYDDTLEGRISKQAGINPERNEITPVPASSVLIDPTQALITCAQPEKGAFEEGFDVVGKLGDESFQPNGIVVQVINPGLQRTEDGITTLDGEIAEVDHIHRCIMTVENELRMDVPCELSNANFAGYDEYQNDKETHSYEYANFSKFGRIIVETPDRVVPKGTYEGMSVANLSVISEAEDSLSTLNQQLEELDAVLKQTSKKFPAMIKSHNSYKKMTSEFNSILKTSQASQNVEIPQWSPATEAQTMICVRGKTAE